MSNDAVPGSETLQPSMDLQSIRERDSNYTVLDMKWSGTLQPIKDRRHLLNLVERMRPYVMKARSLPAIDQEKIDALLKELAT